MMKNIRSYKGHIIEKIVKGNMRDLKHGYHMEYYLVDNKERFGYLKDAKAYIDSKEDK